MCPLVLIMGQVKIPGNVSSGWYFNGLGLDVLTVPSWLAAFESSGRKKHSGDQAITQIRHAYCCVEAAGKTRIDLIFLRFIVAFLQFMVNLNGSCCLLF